METVFRRAEVSDIPSMQQLWLTAFPDDPADFVQRFFSIIPVKSAFVACKGEVLASLFLLDGTAMINGSTYPVRYLYAGCTHPEYRRQGLYGKLIEFAATQAEADGAIAIYLHPASESLSGYYLHRGFRKGIGWYRKTNPGFNSLSVSTPVTSVSYQRIRAEYFPPNAGCWRLSTAAEQFFLEELVADGWQPFACDAGCGVLSPDGSFVYDYLPQNGEYKVKECAGWFSDGRWENTALYFPLNGCPEISPDTRMYTAFLGDI